MWDYIVERVVREGEYIVETGQTVRSCAAHFSISKSTVHKDVTERLKEVDEGLYRAVRGVLDKNLSERHIRGGMATRDKYLKESYARAECASCGRYENNCKICKNAAAFADATQPCRSGENARTVVDDAQNESNV